MDSVHSIASNLHWLMFRKDVSISEVSRSTGISRTTITALYRRRSKAVSFEVIEKLCRYFECDVGDLFKVRDEMPVA